MRRRPTCSRDQVLALGVTTTLVQAGEALGIGRTTAHRLAREGQFPVPVEMIGGRYVVPTEPLLRLLRLDDAPELVGAP